MASKIGSGIIKNGLILHLDAASPTNYALTNVEVLVVAGGGGGGWDVGGGGGGGGVCYSKSYPITPGSAISVTIGNGGAGANQPTGAGRAGSGGRAGANGDNSVFGAITALGGGGGGGWSNVSGANGGSGGGQTSNSGDAAYSATQTGGAYYVGYGNPGGISARNTSPGDNNYSGASGGGGAGGPGGGGINNGTWTLNSSLAGFGGPGLPFNISGTTKYYGGGGGSSSDNSIYTGIGGIGGGANGGEQNGEANTGGGGGGGGLPTNIGGTGGSGIVIVRYPGPQKATGGNTITQVDGYTIHTFTSSGTFTPLSVPSNGGTVYGLQDLSGNNRGGNVSGNPTYTSANNGTIAFSGVVGSYINLQEFPTITNQPISVFAFVYATDSTGSRGVWGYLRADGRNCHFETNNGQWRVRLADLNNSTITPVTLNTWQYVGFSYDGFNNSFYINGTLISTWSGSSGTMFGPVAAANLGNAVGDSNPVARPWQGNISNVQYYYKALTLTEIQQNFNALRGRFGI